MLRAIRRSRALLATVVGSLVITLFATSNAYATYFFLPGHPMFFGGPGWGGWCTGGYAIHGTDGTFLVTAAHCGGSTVYGTDSAFGYVFASHSTTDTEIIREYSGSDAYQTVYDNTTYTTVGRVTSWTADADLTAGRYIEKSGSHTGRTGGDLTGAVSYDPTGVICYWTTAYADGGDSGGPVYINNYNGTVSAVGMTRAVDGSHNMCFEPIQDILYNWGATLPVWNYAATNPHAAASAPVGKPQLPAGVRVVPWPAAGRHL